MGSTVVVAVVGGLDTAATETWASLVMVVSEEVGSAAGPVRSTAVVPVVGGLDTVATETGARVVVVGAVGRTPRVNTLSSPLSSSK